MLDQVQDDMLPRLTVEMITPEIARDLIARKRPSAHPNDAAVKAYAQVMAQDGWILNGMPLIFSKTGILLDGLCRLKACIIAARPFTTTVAQNIDDDVLHTIDQHRRRQYAGVLESRGERHAKTLQETLSKLLRYADGMMPKPNYAIPWARLDRVLAANPELRDAVKLGIEHPAKTLNITLRCVLAHMGLSVAPPSLRRFLDAVAYPERFDATEPGAVIRTMLESQRGQRRVDPVKILAVCIKALNATINPPAEPPRFYRWIAKSDSRLGEDFPSLVGYKGLKDPAATTASEAMAKAAKPCPVISSAEVLIVSETITPGIAEEYLRNNSKNRAIVRAHVEAIARDIGRGAWLLNAQPICFSASGRLLNGQHRLSACILADLPIELFVVRGLSEATYATYDLQAKKAPAIEDLLATTGDKNAVHAAACLIWRETRGQAGRKERPTAVEVRDTLSRNPGLLEGRHYARRNQSLGRLSTLLFVAHKLRQESPALASYFLEKLETGAELQSGDPILDLRNRLLRLRAQRKQYDPGAIVELVIGYWDRFLRTRGVPVPRRADLAQS